MAAPNMKLNQAFVVLVVLSNLITVIYCINKIYFLLFQQAEVAAPHTPAPATPAPPPTDIPDIPSVAPQTPAPPTPAAPPFQSPTSAGQPEAVEANQVIVLALCCLFIIFFYLDPLTCNPGPEKLKYIKRSFCFITK